jgi:hypothetical protein
MSALADAPQAATTSMPWRWLWRGTEFTQQTAREQQALSLSVLFVAAALAWQVCFLARIPAYVATFIALPIAVAIIAIGFKWRSPMSWLSLLLIGLAVAAVSVSGDALWDGNYYHKNAAFAISEGWSPWQRAHWEPFGGAYPVGRWVWDAAFYVLTGDIRFSHLTSLLFLVATSIVTFNTLAAFIARPAVRYVWTLVFAANPIMLGQFFSGLVDGLAGVTLATAWLALIRWIIFKHRAYLWIGLCWLVVAATMKFTAVAVAVYTIAVVAAACVARFGFNRSVRDLSVMAVGLALIGAANLHPLVTNWTTHGHALWPALGAQKLDIISGMVDAKFLAFPPGIRDLWSLFSYTGNVQNQLPQLKFPGVVTHAELAAFSSTSSRIAGMGPWFSLALLATLLASVAARKHTVVAGIRIGLLSVGLSIFVLGACIVVQHGWWIRFASFVWLLPVFLCALPWQCSVWTTKLVLATATGALVACSIFAGYDAMQTAQSSFASEQQAGRFVRDCKSGAVTISGAHLPFVRNYQRMLSDRGYPTLLIPYVAALPDPLKNFHFADRFVLSCGAK